MDRRKAKPKTSKLRSQEPVIDPKYLPKIEFRAKPDGIFIPSVSSQTKAPEDSPRSVESGVSGTAPVRSGDIVSPVRTRGKKIIVEVSTKSGPVYEDHVDNKISSLDKHLPIELRGSRERIKAEAMLRLRQTLSMQSSIIPSCDADDYSWASDDPQHASSGSSVRLFNKALSNSSPAGHWLWGHGGEFDEERPLSAQLTMEEKEKVLELGGSMEALDAENDGMELESLARKLQEAKSNAHLNSTGGEGDTVSLHSEDASFLEEMSQSSLDLIKQYRGADRSFSSEKARLAPASQEGGLRVGSGSDERKGEEGNQEVENPQQQHKMQGEAVRGLGVAAPTVEADNVDTSSPMMSLTSSPKNDRLTSRTKETNPFMKVKKRASSPSEKARASAMDEVMKPKIELTSKARATLMDLGRFVQGHMNRKVMVAWTTIEQRFAKSTHKKVEYVIDANGLSHPVKYNALYLSALTGTLCSPQVRCSYKDLTQLYESFGCTDEDIFKSRRLAALRIVLGPTNGKGLKQEEELLGELAELMHDTEPLVSKEVLLNAVFPADPEERSRVFRSLEGEKAAYVKKMVAEREKKEELKRQVETRRVKMISDFDRTRGEVQFPKGPLLYHRHKTIKDLIAYCERAYEDHHAASDVQVAEENITLIGLDAFPECVKRGVREEEERMRQKQRMFMKSKKPSSSSSSKALGSPPSLPKTSSPASTSSGATKGGSSESKASLNTKKEEVMKKLKDNEQEAADAKRKIKEGRMGYEGQFRISIQVTRADLLPVLKLIREVVSYGKGLNGIAYRDVIELLQSYAATRLQAFFRAYKRRWRYTIARAKWTTIFRASKLLHFKTWSVFIRHVYDTRNLCWRKLVAWHVYTKYARRRRERFRINFWPFYVWHRWAAASRTAKEKGKFLGQRVYPTLNLLRVFRGWKGVYMSEKALRDRADDFHLMVLKYHSRISLGWWRRWTRRRMKLRAKWYKYGIVTYKRKIFMRKVTPFLIWKMVWYYKKTLHARICSLAATFRNHFVRDTTATPADGEQVGAIKPIKKVPSNGERKAKAKEALEHEEAESESNSQVSDRSGRSSKKSKKKSKKQRKQEQEEAERARAVPLKPFIYTPAPRYHGNDIDSDGEEEAHTPQCLLDVYRAKIPELISPTDVDFLGEADDFIFEKIFVLARRYATVDNWNLCEWSMRYHKLIHKAFRHLRVNAKVTKSARSSQYNHARQVKKRCFMALLSWMLRDPAKIDFAEQTDAERIYADAKAHRMDKMMKWRDVAHEIKEKLDRDEDIDFDFDRELTAAEKRQRRSRRLEKEAKAKADAEAGVEVFKPPNFLEWDREDRNIELTRAEEMLKISIRVRHDAVKASMEADVVSAQFDADEKAQKEILVEVFKQEEVDSSQALEKEFEYVDHFKVHAADHLLAVLWKVYKEVQQFLLREERKKVFRLLRMPMLERRAQIMYNRKKMVNWIRLCRRLGSLYEKAPLYHRRRTCWCFFNRWLKLVEKESLDVSPGLVPYFKRKLEIFPCFANHLAHHGFVKTVYPNNKRLYAVCAEMIAVFKRWAMSITEGVLMRKMEEKAARQYEIKLMLRVWYSMKMVMTPEETYDIRMDSKPYLLKRIDCDLDQMKKRFISRRRKNLQLNITRYNRKYTYYSMREAKRAPSFRNFLEYYRDRANRRVTREQRILVDSFEARGTQEYVDVCCPDLNDACMPGLMRRLDGRGFRDPHPLSEASPLEKPLPGGFRMAKFRVNYQDVNGTTEASITGWQVVWGADGMPDTEGPKRGKWKGAAMKVHELVIPKNDFVMGLEYVYEGTAILGLRLKMFFAGFSRWLGQRPGLSSLSVYLGTDKAPRQDFEDEYECPGRDERENAAMPRDYVIGFSGVESEGKVSGMTLIVRKIRDQHIFSYFWVKDAFTKTVNSGGKAGPPSEFNVPGNGDPAILVDTESQADASLGLRTLPPIVDPNMATFERGAVRDEESLTMEGSLPPLEEVKAERARARDAKPSERADDMSSIGHGSLTGTAAEGTVENGSAGGDQGSVGSQTVMDSTAVIELLSSEEQFFDCLRMRTMETHTALGRAEGFARRLWQARHLRHDPVLSKLTGIKIIMPLTMWYFQAICKRLVRATSTEDEGEELLERSRNLRSQVDRLNRQTVAAALKRDDFVSTPQYWQRLKILSPKDRAEKKLFYEQARQLSAVVDQGREKSVKLLEESVKLEKLGKNLLPRLQLSVYTCENFRLKIAAARHKETLLERMDMNAIKKALSGGDAKNSELSEVSMEMIRSSLAGKRPQTTGIMTLQDVIDTEMSKAEKPPARTSASITVPSTSASALDGDGSPLGLKRSKRSESSPNKVVAGSRPAYMNTHAEQRVVMGTSYRKASGINAPNFLSATTAASVMESKVGETRWVRRKSQDGTVKLTRDKGLEVSKSTSDLNLSDYKQQQQ